AARAMTNSDIYLVAGSTPVLTSFEREESREIEEWIRERSDRFYRDVTKKPEIISIAASSGVYEGVLCAMDGRQSTTPSQISFLLIRSIDKEVQAALKPVIKSF